MNPNQDIIKTIQRKDSSITLIGTAHVSHESVRLVEETVQSGAYDCVAVELCQPRYENLINLEWWKNLDIFQVFRQNKATLLFVNMALTAYQKRLAEKLGAKAGMEMQRAVDLARQNNIRLELIDRNISTTLARIIHRVTFWQKIKLISGLAASVFVGEEITEEQIEELKSGDLLQSVVEEFATELPAVKEVLIDERDQYMTGKLAALADAPGAPRNIVAMVGAGHLGGMLPAFAAPASAERLAELDQKPPPTKTAAYIGWGILVLVLGLFYVGFRQSPAMGWQLALTWASITGGLCALGAAMAFAHPLSVLTGLAAAPITTLHPALSAGMVVGMVEAYLRKPKVSDFESLRDDIAHFRGWRHNRVARVFLIFFMSNMGAAIGVYVAGASIVHQLFVN